MKNLPASQKFFNVVIGLVVLIVVANLFWLNWLAFEAKKNDQQLRDELFGLSPQTDGSETATTISEVVGDECNRDCVEELIAEQLSLISAPTATPAKPVSSVPTVTASKVSFYNLSSGTAAGTAWTPVLGTEFWLDTALYGTEVVATWEGRLALKDGNGVGFVRLYDMTNNRGVDGSQAEVRNGTTISFYSQSLALWRGQNQYRIEVSSTTGYEVTVSSPRIKLVY